MIKKNYPTPSNRSCIDKFLVMDIFARSSKIETYGKKVFHFELGEPLKRTPLRVIKKTKEITSIELRLDATVKAYNIIFLTQPCI